MNEALHGIAELPSYTRLADKLLSTEERQDLINYLADHPKAGDVMEGTGGVRKLGSSAIPCKASFMNHRNPLD